MTFDPEQLRVVMRSWTTGVALVSAAFDGKRHGMTVSSFTSVAMEPPLVLVCINAASRTHDLIQGSGRFAVSILAEGQEAIASRFAGGHDDQDDRFSGLKVITTPGGCQVPEGSLAYVDCGLVAGHPAGTSTIFVGQVTAAEVIGHGQPLLYYQKGYRRLQT
jgi:flavin reductase (DIM6/NTAB) family NADH-FMN oxidoreductase RutF